MSIIKHVTLQKIVAHDFRYDPCMFVDSWTLKMEKASFSEMLVTFYQLTWCRISVDLNLQLFSPLVYFRKHGVNIVAT